jgi:hypothetical protein
MELSDLSEEFNRKVNGVMSVVDNNKIISTVVCLFLVLYASLAAPKLPKSITAIFKNTWFKLIFMFLIAYMATHNPAVAIISAVGLLITLQTLNAQETADQVINSVKNRVNENFQNAASYTLQNTDNNEEVQPMIYTNDFDEIAGYAPYNQDNNNDEEEVNIPQVLGPNVTIPVTDNDSSYTTPNIMPTVSNNENNEIIENKEINEMIDQITKDLTQIMNEEKEIPEDIYEETDEEVSESTFEVTPEATFEVTPEVTPEATFQVTPEATFQVTPEATFQVTPEATFQVKSEAPFEAMPEAPFEAMPEAPFEAMPEAPFEAIPEAPFEAIPEAIFEPTLTITPETTFAETSQAIITREEFSNYANFKSSHKILNKKLNCNTCKRETFQNNDKPITGTCKDPFENLPGYEYGEYSSL